MFVKRVSEPMKNAEVFADVMEDVFACVPGAYEYDIVSDERINNLHKRMVEIMDESGDKIAKVEIRCYPNEEQYIVEVELINGTPTPLFRIYTAREAEKKWGLGYNTVTKWIFRGKFRVNEARKSEGTWIVTHEGMVRVAGEPRKGGEQR
ncbi:helix-turn-helix domain-containing protein [Parageobacillus thermoglucosidasius]|uniref:helix-turn-helix domain-containing protein n=1 Tax=Parageobacillus thermoglucosidasius TaxID=1426 RepID=UPI002E1BC2D1|nr:helix-turn-helix domain-containing protein [Parageobacillus thermoglucosidasius]MED4946531.1 helix-turn-helix domain-containing protein [Parageobacillus thermoglucosidasius]MED4984916.1 helix-turn-helix domain-containing protein [Parageobacillus thermoglucosidasius]